MDADMKGELPHKGKQRERRDHAPIPRGEVPKVMLKLSNINLNINIK